MSDNDKIVELPTGYAPDPATLDPKDLEDVKELLRWAIEEIVLLSTRVNKLTKALAAERRK